MFLDPTVPGVSHVPDGAGLLSSYGITSLVKRRDTRNQDTQSSVTRQEVGEAVRLRIKQVFGRSGLSQRSFSDRLGLKQGVVQRWLVDDPRLASVPDAASVALVCREFGVSGQWLLAGQLPVEVTHRDAMLETAYLVGWWEATEAHRRAYLSVAPPDGVSRVAELLANERLKGVYETIEAGEGLVPPETRHAGEG